MLQELIPADRETTRPVPIDVIHALLTNTTTPRFAVSCRGFLDVYRAGDELVEFCSALKDWREGLGWSGYRLMRGGALIDTLIVKMS